MKGKRGGFKDPAAAGRKGGKATGPKTKTILFESWGKDLLSGGTVRAKKELNSLAGKEYLEYYIKLLEFFKPRLARQEIIGDSEHPVSIKLIRGNSDSV